LRDEDFPLGWERMKPNKDLLSLLF